MSDLMEDETGLEGQVASDDVLLGSEDDGASSGESGVAGTPEPAAPAAPAAPEDRFAAVFELAKEMGREDIVKKYGNGRAAFEGLLNASVAVSRRDPYVDLGRRVADHAEEFEEYLRTKRQPQRSAQAEPDPNEWRLPEPLPQQVTAHLYRDEHGVVRPMENAPIEVVREWEKHERLRQEFAREFTTNPRSVFSRLQQQFEQTVLDKVEQRLAQRDQYVQQRAAEKAAVGQVADWLWQYGPDGKVVRTFDHERGTEVNVLTPKGREYAMEVERLMTQPIAYDSAGHPVFMPSTRAHELALRLIGGPPQPTQPAVPAPVSPAGPRRQRAAAPASDDRPQSLFEIALAAGEVSAAD